MEINVIKAFSSMKNDYFQSMSALAFYVENKFVCFVYSCIHWYF